MKYINFTTGKLCKQKGLFWESMRLISGPKFDESGHLISNFQTETLPGIKPIIPGRYTCYNETGEEIIPKKYNLNNNHYPRFFQSELQRILRENFSIHVWCVPRRGNSYNAYVQDYNINGMLSCDVKDSYEDALEEGLVKALNLLPDLK